MNEVTGAVREGSRGVTVWGIATIILGVLAVMSPYYAGEIVAIMVAILLIAAGLARLFYAFKAESFGKGVLTFLFGGLSILAGVIMLARPVLGMLSLTVVLIVYFLVDGISQIIGSFRLRPVKGWGWLLFSGILSVVLAILLWQQWPVSGVWAIGVLVGVHLIFAGWSMIAVGAVGEGVADEAEAAPRG